MKVSRFSFLILTLFVFSVSATAQIQGSWKGKLSPTPAMALNIVFHIDSDADGSPVVTMDSPDQGVKAIPAKANHISIDSISISVPEAYVTYNGKLLGNRIIGTFTQGLVNLPLTLTRGSIEINRPQTPKAPFPYTEEEITFTNPTEDGVTLSGTLVIPDNATSKTPVVLMVTGSGLQNRDEELFSHKPFAVIADHLARHGIASLRYDDRGTAKSTGDNTAATTMNYAADAAAGIKWLQDSHRFKTIGLIGHSEGGLIGEILASGKINLPKPDFIIAIGGPTTRGDKLLIFQSEQALKQSGITDTTISAYSSSLGRMYERLQTQSPEDVALDIDEITSCLPDDETGRHLKDNIKSIITSMSPWILEFIRIEAADYIKGITCPALFVFGDLDLQVPPSLNTPIFDNLPSNFKTKTFAGLNHLMQHASTGQVNEYPRIEETFAPEVLETITSFIKNL